jgi:hypothetical protein
MDNRSLKKQLKQRLDQWINESTSHGIPVNRIRIIY